MSVWTKLRQRFLATSWPEVENGLEGKHPVQANLENNLEYIAELFADSVDLVCRRLQIARRQAAVVYLRDITNEQLISQGVVRPLLNCKRSASVQDILDCIDVSDYATHSDLNSALQLMLDGRVLLLCQGFATAINVEAIEIPGRNITEPDADVSISGPREGFNESLADNYALVRRRLRTPQLKSKVMRMGVLSRTGVVICYLADRVDKQLLSEVEQRLQHMQEQENMPEILDSYYIMESISDHPMSPFPQVLQTERPDVIVAHLVEGRVALLVEATPVALVVPAAFFDLFQTADDFYTHSLIASMARLLRLASIFVATTVSALYVAVTTFHYEVIPSRLVISVAQTRRAVPLSSFAEAMILEIALDLLREATIRLPTTVGQVIGVVGALIVGQAAVQANLVSPLLVIVVSLSTIASFSIPNNELASALRLVRFPLIIAANFL